MAHDLGGLVLHRHDALGMAQGHPRGKLGVAGEKRTEDALVAVQDHVQTGMLGDGIDQAGNNSCRPTIAAHGVN